MCVNITLDCASISSRKIFSIYIKRVLLLAFTIHVRIFYAFRMLRDTILEVYQILEKNIQRNARRTCSYKSFHLIWFRFVLFYDNFRKRKLFSSAWHARIRLLCELHQNGIEVSLSHEFTNDPGIFWTIE